MTDDPFSGLNARFALAGLVKIVPGNGGLAKIQIETPAASAEIYLHGAQIASWRPAGAQEVLFLSGHSRWEEGRAIRGGIPICFPWFRGHRDAPAAPAHGIVRTKAWEIESIVQAGDSVAVTLATGNDENGRRWWPHDFRLTLRIAVGAELTLELTAANTGSTPFEVEEALHTYYRVGDVEQVRLAGLDGVRFLDNRDGNREKTQHDDVTFAAQTDNAYLHTQGALVVADPALQRRILIEKRSSATTIVWNPWSDGAAALADLGDQEWRHMVCVEAGNILGAAVRVEPGAEHTMGVAMRVLF